MEERLQKIMSHAGFGSRRACEELIIAGRVRVNGKPAELGQKADPAVDKITVDGKPVAAAQDYIYIALNKPRYVVSAAEPEPGDRRQTVRDLVPVEGHIYPVGRLDVDSEGLVLMTNDGDLANKLTHPRYGHEKEYKVLVARHPDAEQLETWRRGVVLEDGYKTQPVDVRVETLVGKGAWLRVILREGRKRQIREMGARTGLPVVRIVRIRIGPLLLGPLKPKEWRYLTPAEVAALKRGDKQPVREARPGRKSTDRKPVGRPVRGKPESGERPARPRKPAASGGRAVGGEEGGPGRARRPGRVKPGSGSAGRGRPPKSKK
ncbi:MAG: pseudouridine synthase [Anaerolineales bacterium]